MVAERGRGRASGVSEAGVRARAARARAQRAGVSPGAHLLQAVADPHLAGLNRVGAAVLLRAGGGRKGFG
jgi:hypothetical protein